MRLLLDFEPCDECRAMMQELGSLEMAVAGDAERADGSARFLRHLTYNHAEVVQGIMRDLPEQKRRQEYDFFR